jgi:hypothetical protein
MARKSSGSVVVNALSLTSPISASQVWIIGIRSAEGVAGDGTGDGVQLALCL